MERINLTLDDDTATRLIQHAKRGKLHRATLARDLIREALERRDARERQRKLALDYAAGRADAAELLADLETPQLELLEEP